jgi:DNA polymerase
MIISIDFETRSMVNLRKTGVYPYAEHWSTDVWCMAYAIDDGPVKVWTPNTKPRFSIRELFPKADELRAWNAGFEHIIYRDIMVPRYGFPAVDMEQWVDTAAEAAAMSLPRGLGKAAQVLGLDTQKDNEGYKLMMKMAKPRCIGAWWVGNTGPFPTKAAAMEDVKAFGLDKSLLYKDDHTVMWWDTPEMIQRLIEYCVKDVEVERAIKDVLRPLRPAERGVYLMTQRMNDRGVYVDSELVDAAADIVEQALVDANLELSEITGGAVTKVSQVAKLTAWLAENGLVVDNLRKDTVRDLLAGDDITDPVIRRVLEIRRDGGKTSTGKLAAFQRCVAEDHRAHGLLVYHGASTGRWTASLVQPQNFPRPDVDGVEELIPMVREREYNQLCEAGHAPLPVVSSMLRSMMCAAPGHTLLAGDYSQIEARVLAWIAGQDSLTELFRSGGKIYETMASYIFNIPVDEIAKDSFERQIGKNSILGFGFQMGENRFAEQVQEQSGIVLDRGSFHLWCPSKYCRWRVRSVPRDQVPPKVGERRCPRCRWDQGTIQITRERPDLAYEAKVGYRTLYPRIAQFWKDIESAAVHAVMNPGENYDVGVGHPITFTFRGQFLHCRLPSKRYLYYAKPEIRERRLPAPYDDVLKPSLRYLAVDSLTKQWRGHYTYGGHLTENVVQAMARDLMAGAMLRMEQAGYAPVLTVHDEVVVEAPTENADLSHFMDLMRVIPSWAEGLPVAAEGWQGQRYRK